MTLSLRPGFLLVVATLIASVAVVTAQSGRRGTAKSTAPNTPSVSEPKTPETKPQTSAGRLQLLVAIQDPSALDGVPYYVADTVVATCTGRLNESSAVYATVASRKLTRGDAIKIAKGETQRYVIWLEVRSEMADSGRRSSSGADDFYITYMVFEPATAKVKRSGRAQPGIYKTGNVGIGLPPSSRRNPVYSDYVIKESAREAADRILAAFEIRVDGAPR